MEREPEMARRVHILPLRRVGADDVHTHFRRLVMLKLGMVAYPLVAVGMIAHKNAAIGPFVDVNAFTPDTARKPESLKVDYRAVRRAVRTGVLVPVGDGRYFVDEPRWKKRFIRNLVVFGGIGALLMGIILMPEITRFLG